MEKKIIIDSVSKNKMLASYDMYSLKNKKLDVLYSYKDNVLGFNVYAFSDYFHIGIKNIDGTMVQKFIDIRQNNSLDEKYLDIENSKIRIYEQMNDSEKDKLFETVQKKVNRSIDEFINRNNVYNNYIRTKKRQLELIRETVEKKIKSQEDVINRMLSKKITFEVSDNEFISLEIVAREVTSDVHKSIEGLEWSIARTPENLNILLLNSDRIFYDTYSNNSIIPMLFNFLIIVSYYTSDEMFENIFMQEDYYRDTDELIRGIKRIFDNNINSKYILQKPMRESYQLRSYMTSQLLSNFNYDSITNVDHLIKIYQMYEILVESHKKYVDANTRGIEMNLFDLTSIGGSKQTKQILNQLLQIDRLSARINLLTRAEELRSRMEFTFPND